MFLNILPNTGKLDLDIDTDLVENISSTNSRKLKDMR